MDEIYIRTTSELLQEIRQILGLMENVLTEEEYINAGYQLKAKIMILLSEANIENSQGFQVI